jgi:hypothetical protein
MTQDLKLELAEMVGPAEWKWLSPHASRDAVVVVDEKLELAEVGVALATDDVPTVNRWIAEALIAKPTPNQLESWEQNAEKRFQSLIVQPFVLVQDSLTDEN